MSIRRLICTTPAPSMAGSIRRNSLRTSGVAFGNRSVTQPSRRAAVINQNNWASPATATPHASAWLGVSSQSAKPEYGTNQDKVQQISAAATPQTGLYY